VSAVEPIVLYRWVAKITYRRDTGNETRIVSFEELYELHDIIERGPDFYAIEGIEVRIGARALATTIEQAERS
jgi:hypothetical protein